MFVDAKPGATHPQVSAGNDGWPGIEPCRRGGSAVIVLIPIGGDNQWKFLKNFKIERQRTHN
jgi:hypothetical protein